MIDESKIKEAANNYVGCEPSRDEGSQLSAERASFMDGAQWAQQEFVKTLWHDASEEPQIKRHIIALSKVGMFVYDFNFKKGDKWSLYFDIYKIIRWAYLSDILQKEGGEK